MKNKFLPLLLLIVILMSFAPEKRQWVAIGDSITYLNDHPEQTGNRITKGYMTLITQEHPELNFINQGHNGWTAVKIAEKIETLNIVKADVYTVFLGTNDWWQGKPLGSIQDYENNTGYNTFFGAYRIIVDYLKKLNPEAKVVLITPMQRVDFVYIANPKNNAFGSYRAKNNQQLEAFAEAVKAIAKKEGYKSLDLYHEKKLAHKTLVNFKRLKDPQTGEYKNYPFPDFIDVPFNPEKDEYPYPVESIAMTYDGLHPSDKGYEIIAKRLWKLMK